MLSRVEQGKPIALDAARVKAGKQHRRECTQMCRKLTRHTFELCDQFSSPVWVERCTECNRVSAGGDVVTPKRKPRDLGTVRRQPRSL